MADAKRDSNQITTLLAVSNADGVTPVVLWADPTTHRLLVDLPAGAGTVTTVSVVSANGFAGTVATATTTPAITLTTTVTGILQGNGTAISAATTTGSGSVVLGTTPTLATPVINGTPTGTGVATAATGSTLALRDANGNLTVNQLIDGYTTTATAGGTTTLTAASTQKQFFTGVTVQTVVLPDVTTLVLGQDFMIDNNSSGNVTVQSSGLNNVVILAPNTRAVLTCILTSGTTAASWDAHYYAVAPVSGKKILLSDSMTFNTNSITFAGGEVLTLSATNAISILTTGSTSVTLPTSGTLYGTATGSITSAQLATSLSDETGSGSAVFATSPTLVTPVLGVASATSVNKVAITAPAASATLTIADGKTLTASNSITLAGTDATTMTFPTTSATIARTDAGQTFTGVQVMTSPKIITQISDTNGNAIIAITATASAVNYVKLTNAATGTAGPQIAAEGETNTDLKISAKGTGKINHQSGTYQTLQSDTDGATVTFDMSVSNLHTVTLGGNRTLALSNVAAGQSFVLRLAQDATGSRTVTWFTTIKWAGGAAPTLTTTASKTDVFGFICTSAGNYDGFVIGQNL